MYPVAITGASSSITRVRDSLHSCDYRTETVDFPSRFTSRWVTGQQIRAVIHPPLPSFDLSPDAALSRRSTNWHGQRKIIVCKRTDRFCGRKSGCCEYTLRENVWSTHVKLLARTTGVFLFLSNWRRARRVGNGRLWFYANMLFKIIVRSIFLTQLSKLMHNLKIIMCSKKNLDSKNTRIIIETNYLSHTNLYIIKELFLFVFYITIIKVRKSIILIANFFANNSEKTKCHYDREEMAYRWDETRCFATRNFNVTRAYTNKNRRHVQCKTYTHSIHTYACTHKET